MRTIAVVDQQTAVPAADMPPVIAAIQAGLDTAFLPASTSSRRRISATTPSTAVVPGA